MRHLENQITLVSNCERLGFRSYTTNITSISYLGINTNNFAALIAIVGENIFVTFDTVRMIVS